MNEGGRTSAVAAAAQLDWESARLFLALFRGGSLASAAARLGVDVSTVSRRLDRIEETLGVRLFDRRRDGTLPTAAAEQMVPPAEEMELAMARFTAAGAAHEKEVEGIVRLTCPPGVADAFLAPALATLLGRHPRLRLELDASISYADLTRREADIAIRTTRPSSGDLVSTRLVQTRAVPMTSPGYAGELGRLRRLEDARWITWAADLAHLATAQWLHEHGPGIVPVLATSHFASQLAAARAGLGVLLAGEPFGSTGLVAVAPAKSLAPAWAALPHEEVWLVGHRALRQVPRIAAVWDFVLEVIGERVYDDTQWKPSSPGSTRPRRT